MDFFTRINPVYKTANAVQGLIRAHRRRHRVACSGCSDRCWVVQRRSTGPSTVAL